MPLIASSSYLQSPAYLWNGHVETIVPAVARRVKVPYERERLELPDGDFVDLDWLDKKSRRLLVLTHGLEGNSRRNYVQATARFFAQEGWDVLAWNCRSCSGEMNRLPRLYHHGEIGDFGQVIQHAFRTKDYEQVALVGFSMGGSITLKYLGVQGKELPDAVKTGIAFSTPCDIEASIRTLELPVNRFYKNRFYKKLRRKIELKAIQFPGLIDAGLLNQVKTWRDFDTFFSAPLNGFDSPETFYQQASCVNYMEGIRVPALLANAQNDPILSPECSPAELCRRHPNVYLEMPARGGHVGFTLHRRGFSWMEQRAMEFIQNGK
ncbi:MAG TPA: alpha/beta fold hydrolase [Saprospiraceae bacterium]|nr:alpha/beta fold hydrolase [Saprospiraceae bacterium]HRK79986.1 alpha/beta fold hydrolase [Saprospiraceae bacterium]